MRRQTWGNEATPRTSWNHFRVCELKLKDFGVVADRGGLSRPVVTRFEIQPAAGVKVSRISNLAKDLARSLAVISVRG